MIHRIFFFLLFITINFANAAPLFDAPLFDIKGALLSHPLKELLTLTGLDQGCDQQWSIHTVVEETQKHWLRKGERWDAQEEKPFLDEEKRFKILMLADQLGYIQGIAPSRRTYHTVLFLGAASIRIQDRLNYLISLWNKGVRFEKIVMLGSTRSLDTPEADALLKSRVEEEGLASNELGLMRYLYDHTAMPKEMKSIPVQYVCTKAPEGKTRADTDDTIKAWLSSPATSSPKKAHVLIISNQPYCAYQHHAILTIFAKILKNNAPFLDTVGSASSLREYLDQKKAPSHQDSVILMDTIARDLYMRKSLLPVTF